MDILKKANVSQIVLDEVHCMSMWGNDFRKSYLKIVDSINLFTNSVISCFTATADIEIINDIKQKLKTNFQIFKSSFDRENLFYEVVRTDNKLNYVINFLDNIKEPTIIYTLTRKKAKYIYDVLKKKYNVSLYHGGLDNEIKEEYQSKFLLGKTNIMVATNAFGMGIDKKDIRYVIIYDLPMSILDLSQQQGRASRDLKKGKCILLYNYADLKENYYFINQSQRDSMLSFREARNLKLKKIKDLKCVIEYATTKGCLHEYLINYFGESKYINCNNCSNCLKYKKKVKI